MSRASKKLHIAYAIQNVGGINFKQDIGDTVPVKHSLRGLQKAGHSVTCLKLFERSVFGIEDLSTFDYKWAASLGISGTRPFMSVESGVRKIQGNLGFPYLAMFDSFRFYEACLRHLPGYDLCHEHFGVFSAGAALACLRLGMPYVLTLSAEPFLERSLSGRPLKGIQALIASQEAKLLYRCAHKIICVSEPANQHLVNNWRVDPKKIVVMPNSVDTNLFGAVYDTCSTRAEFGLGNEPIIMFVGSFQVWHGLENLVESFSLVRSEIPNARLMLVGDGPARKLIEQKIIELDVKSSVMITGYIPQARIPVILDIADVAVIPYPKFPNELWFSPLKLYEYMGAGKAIVSSRAGQIADVIDDGCSGLLVEPGNVKEFSRAITSLLRDPGMRQYLGENARRQAVERHSWTQYIKRLEDIYLSVA